jgi:ATP-binding cassette subfamily F protein 3
MISLNNVSLMRGNQLLFENASINLRVGQRTGIIGRNGAGKTSLFKALAQEIPIEQGSIELPNDLRTSTMSQETPGSKRSALEFVIDADKNYRQLERALQKAEAEDDHNAMAHLHSDLENMDGYNIRNRAEQLLSGLGFGTDQFHNAISSFSGGWRVRLNLAAALMCPLLTCSCWGRAHQPPGPGSHRVAGAMVAALSGHLADYFPRPLIPRCGD